MRLARLCLLLLILAAAPCFAGQYLLTIDSSSLLSPPTSGFIDFTFNGGFPATAVIAGFSDLGGALDPSSIFSQGTVSGALNGVVTLGNNNADYDEGLTFGSSISFNLTLSGTPGGSVGDVFTLSFFNSGFTGGLLTGNVNDDWLVQFQMDTQGNITPLAYANPSGGPSFATVTAVPEPASWLFVAAALAVIASRFFSCEKGVRRGACNRFL
jgi:hypothetical protein